MARSHARFTRRRLASTLLALALAPGCSYVHDFMIWRQHGAEIAALEARNETIGDAGAVEAKRDRLLDVRARAWANVDRGGKPEGYAIEDALALSRLARTLDARTSWDHVPVAGRATLAELPRASWWYLFTPPSQWSRGPLALDERLPGYYAAMMDAMEHVIATAKPDAPVPTAPAYLELRRLAATGVFDRAHRTPLAARFAHARHYQPVAVLHDLRTLHVEHLAQALSELKAEGIAGWNAEIQRVSGGAAPPEWLAKLLAEREDVNPHSKPVKLTYRRAGFHEWLIGSTSYEPYEAERWAAQWLADYAAEIAKIPHRTPNEYFDLVASQALVDDFAMAARSGARPAEDLAAAVRPIARLVRRLQVTQLFDRRVAVVDTALLLNYLLACRGLPPAIVEDPSMFGGREPIEELAAEIVKGQQRFQVLVRELVARETVKPPGAVARPPGTTTQPPGATAPQLVAPAAQPSGVPSTALAPSATP